MKKIFLIFASATLFYGLQAMNKARVPQSLSIKRLAGLQLRNYSTKKPLCELQHKEVKELVSDKRKAYQTVRKALFAYEDTKPPSQEPSKKTKTLWRRALRQFSVQNWESIKLQREQRHVLASIDPNLAERMKDKIKFSECMHYNTGLKRHHSIAQEHYQAKPLKPTMQQYYQQQLHNLGYRKTLGTIYLCNGLISSEAHAIHPNIFITPNFFDLPPHQRLGILAHEDQHNKNYHQHKLMIIASLLNAQKAPDIFAQFLEKEADVRASISGRPTLALGLFDYFSEAQTKPISNYSVTHPSLSERLRYMSDLIEKLEKEKNGYAWNPFHRMLGLGEWIKKNKK